MYFTIFTLYIASVASLSIKGNLFLNTSEAAHSSSNGLGQGVGMYYWYDRSFVQSLQCFKSEGYDRLFIYLYYNDSIEDDAVNVINDLFSKKNDFKVEFMLLPSFTDSNKDSSPEDVISAVNQSLSNIPLDQKFVWLDTYFLSNPDPSANIDYITRLRAAADKLSIRVDILTTSDVWIQHMSNTDVFSKQGAIIWDDVVKGQKLDKRYGGWNEASVYSMKAHHELCTVYHADVFYNKDQLEGRVKGASNSFALLSFALSLILLKL